MKSGISHPRLRPTLAVVDPLLTVTQPAGVTASAGMDILCHALESYTARAYTAVTRKQPEQRVPYCGANPVSDMWSEKAMSLLATSFRRAVRHGDDVEARREMSMASDVRRSRLRQRRGAHPATPTPTRWRGRSRDFHPEGYPADEAMVPHGMAVSLTAPEAFRFTFDATPDRHVRAAQLLEPGVEMTADPADLLPGVLARLMRGHRDPRRHRRRRASAPATSTGWSRARSSSSGCSRSPPKHRRRTIWPVFSPVHCRCGEHVSGRFTRWGALPAA